MVISLNWKPQSGHFCFSGIIFDYVFITEESIALEMSVSFCLVMVVVIFSFFRRHV